MAYRRYYKSYKRDWYYQKPSYKGTDKAAFYQAGRDARDEYLDSEETSERYYDYKYGRKRRRR